MPSISPPQATTGVRKLPDIHRYTFNLNDSVFPDALTLVPLARSNDSTEVIAESPDRLEKGRQLKERAQQQTFTSRPESGFALRDRGYSTDVIPQWPNQLEKGRQLKERAQQQAFTSRPDSGFALMDEDYSTDVTPQWPNQLEKGRQLKARPQQQTFTSRRRPGFGLRD